MKAWKGRQGKSDGKEKDDKERTARVGARTAKIGKQDLPILVR